ncbi:MAG: hypothetical protein H6937_09545 [Burkholderiales bacterium]|nr:hypothetical protein [Burkholderiales bacterium]
MGLTILNAAGGGGGADGAKVTISSTWAGRDAPGTHTNSIIKITDIPSLNETFSLWLDTGTKHLPVTIPVINWTDLSTAAKFGASLGASAATFGDCEFFVQNYGLNGFRVRSNGTRWFCPHPIQLFSDASFSAYTAAGGAGKTDVITATIPAGLAAAGDFWELHFVVDKSANTVESTDVEVYIGSNGASASDTLVNNWTNLTGSVDCLAMMRRIAVQSATSVIDAGPSGPESYPGSTSANSSTATTITSSDTNDSKLTITLKPGATDTLTIQTAMIAFVTLGTGA